MKRVCSGVFLFSALMSLASAQVLTNGDFESFTGTFGAAGAARKLAGQTTLTGWTPVIETSIGRNGNIYNITASSGENSLDLTSYRAIGANVGLGVEQLMTGLVAGAPYRVSFDLGISNLPCVSGGINCTGPIYVRVAAGAAEQVFVHDSDLPQVVWERYALDFVAADSESLLRFTVVSAPGYGAGLDDVRVSAIPEPGTYALWLAGLALLGTQARRRRASASRAPASV
jgi:hypothetical protein